MIKIHFDDTTYIWKSKLNIIKDRSLFLKEAYSLIKSMPNVKTDGFAYKREWTENLDFMGDFKIEKKLDEIVQIGVNECKKLYNEKNVVYNKVNTEAWINVVRSKDPVQTKYSNGKKYHIHTEINKEQKEFAPHYTYVYYIQMPDIMEDEDGVLYFKGDDEKEYWIRPEEDDLIIMNANMPHHPNSAPKSTLDRIVMSGNVGFEFIKNQKSLI